MRDFRFVIAEKLMNIAMKLSASAVDDMPEDADTQGRVDPHNTMLSFHPHFRGGIALTTLTKMSDANDKSKFISLFMRNGERHTQLIMDKAFADIVARNILSLLNQFGHEMREMGEYGTSGEPAPSLSALYKDSISRRRSAANGTVIPFNTDINFNKEE